MGALLNKEVEFKPIQRLYDKYESRLLDSIFISIFLSNDFSSKWIVPLMYLVVYTFGLEFYR